MPSSARLLVCAGGIYASFLSWALVQERLTSTPYYADHAADNADLSPSFFRHVIFLNTVQSACSAVAALAYIVFASRGRVNTSWRGVLGLDASPFVTTAVKENGKPPSAKLPKVQSSTTAMLARCFQCALMASIGSPFGYVSLRYIDYPTQILGKSCKLVPVMLMNIVLYRRRFAGYKYVVVATVTFGISLFMLYAPASKHKKGAASNSLLGIALLLVNLLIDGAINSTQDEVFVRYRITGTQMMLFMNTFATLITLTSMLLPLPYIPIINPAPLTVHGSTPHTELASAIAFIQTHPAVLRDILLFSLAGATGQLFIFDTLENFGSLTLVTITVTRKLFTMLLSLVVFNHKLTPGQWTGVMTVFGGIGIEAYKKRQESIGKRRQKLKAIKDGDMLKVNGQQGLRNGRLTPIDDKERIKDL